MYDDKIRSSIPISGQKESRGLQVLANVFCRNRKHHRRAIATLSPKLATFLVKPPSTQTRLDRLV